MNKFFALFKVDLLSFMSINKMLHRKGKKEDAKIVGLILTVFFIFAFAVLMSVIYTISFLGMAYSPEFASELGQSLLDEFKIRIPSVFYVICSIIVIFSALKNTSGVLFGGKDYEMTEALPVKSSLLISEKLAFIYLTNLVFYIAIVLPSGIVYGIFTGEAALYYLRLIVILPFTPVIPVIIGTIFGTIVGVITAKFKHANMVNAFFGLALLIAYMVFIFNASFKTTGLYNMAEGALKIFPVSYIISYPMVTGNMPMFLTGIVSSVVLFALYCFLVGKNYKSMNNLIFNRRTKGNYKVKELKTATPVKAVFNKEIKRWLNSSLYLMNTASGMIMFVILTVIFCIKLAPSLNSIDVSEVTGFIKNIKVMINGFLPYLPIFCIGTSCLPGVSISLEGKNLWILKSSPIKAKDIYKAKLWLNYLITIPITVICMAAISIVMKTNAVQTILNFVLPIVFAWFYSLFCLEINLKYPNFEWENEVKAIKQSASVNICVLVGMFLVLPMIALQVVSALFIPFVGDYAACAVIILGLALGAFLMSKSLFGAKGQRIFDKL